MPKYQKPNQINKRTTRSKSKTIKGTNSNININIHKNHQNKKNENKTTNLKAIKSSTKRTTTNSNAKANSTKNNISSKSPNKKDKDDFLKNKKKIAKIMEEIQKIATESESELSPEKEDKDKKIDKDKENSQNIETEKKIPKMTKPKHPKAKKKNKNNITFIIDEELKKSTPIRNLKKKPKGILKKTTYSTQNFILASPPPKSQYRSRSSDKKVTFSSEPKDKKFKTFSEIFQSPSKLKATPLKRKINSEKKSSHKKSNLLLVEENDEIKNDFIGKKRNITFNYERIVKEYNPKTPVRDVKERTTRKSPLERKKVIS